MHNRITCGISSRTLRSYNKEKLTVVFNVVSNKGEVGKVITPLPFVINMKFEDGIIPLTKKDNKIFRRLAYYLIKNHKISIRNIEDNETIVFNLKYNEYPSKDNINLLTKALSDFPNETFEVSFSNYNVDFSIVPFIADKDAFDIIKENDFHVNYFIKCKEDLYKYCCETSENTTHKIKDDNYDFYLNSIKKSLRLKKYKGMNQYLLRDTFYFQPSIFRMIGIYGRGKKSLDSFHYIIDVYWTIFKLINMNINLAQHSSVYPNNIENFEEDNIKFQEQVLSVLKSKLD